MILNIFYCKLKKVRNAFTKIWKWDVCNFQYFSLHPHFLCSFDVQCASDQLTIQQMQKNSQVHVNGVNQKLVLERASSQFFEVIPVCETCQNSNFHFNMYKQSLY